MLPIKGPNDEDDEPSTPLRKAHGLVYIRRFLATKNSWKGKYPRVFCICESSILTLNPTTFEVTNEWSYASDLLDVTTSGIDTTEFSISVKKKESSSVKSTPVANLHAPMSLCCIHTNFRSSSPCPVM